MKLIVGLGNPGEKYEKTRHNLGWRVIDFLVEEMGINQLKEDKKFKSLIGKKNNIILSKPLTFMNNSGQSVKAVADYFKILNQDILIIHDDIDLDLGETRIQEGRGAAGHKGVESIIEHLGTKDFKRIRIGVKPAEENIDTPKGNKFPTGQAEKFVLENFTNQEEKIIGEIIKKAAQIIRTTFKLPSLH